MGKQELPSRRELARISVIIDGRKFYLDIGFGLDKKIRELFVTVNKTGSEERFWIDALARVASLALQYDVPIEDICEQWLGSKCSPSGPVQGDDRIKFCSSSLDWIARHVLANYAGRDDLAHVPAPVPPPEKIMDCGSPSS